MKTYDDRTRGKASTIVIVVVTAVILLGAAVYTPYAIQQDRIDKLNTKVSQLNSQLKSAQQQTPAPNSPTQTNVPMPSNEYMSERGVKVIVYQPEKDAAVSSPLAVVGEVPGNWSFEASFRIQLKNSNGLVVAQTTAQVLGDWMTDQLVPFSAKLTFPSTETGNGTLVLNKDNPSGLAKNADSVSIPIKF